MRIACGAAVAAVLLSGCASTTERVASPPAIVLDPPPRAGVPSVVPGTRTPDYLSPSARNPHYRPQPSAYGRAAPPPTAGFSEWLHSGRGWTWGATSYGPARDLGLDRLMVDTLGSSSPHHSIESPTDMSLVSNEPWLYPPTAVPNGSARPTNPVADGGDRRRPVAVVDEFDEASHRDRPIPATPRDPAASRARPATPPTRNRASDEWQPAIREF